LADLSESVIEAATRQHREFRDTWHRWRDRRTGATRALDKLVRVALVVRNNLQHGEKTRSGPAPWMRDRNQAVGRVVLPVLEAIADAILDRPSERLGVYGTLRPRQPNAGIISVRGEWTDVTLTGWLDEGTGCPAFQFDEAGEKIPACLFISKLLPAFW